MATQEEFNNAAASLKSRAEHGDTQAMKLLGDLLYQGIGGKDNNMGKKIFICPKCKSVYATEGGEKICSDCNISTIGTQYTEDEWYGYSLKQREELKCELISDGRLLEGVDSEISRPMPITMTNNILTTTGNSFEGYKIVKYNGIVFSQGAFSQTNGFASAVLVNILKEFDKTTADMLEQLKTKARERGANAVLGIAFTTSPQNQGLGNTAVGRMLASGTAVTIEKLSEE